MNTVMVVGKLTKDVIFEKVDEETFKAKVNIEIKKNYRNKEGIYETDCIDINLYGNVALNACNYLRKDSVIGVRGSLSIEDNKLQVNAERVSFLNNIKRKEETER